MFTIKVLDPETEQPQKTIKVNKERLLSEIIELSEQGVETDDIIISSSRGEMPASFLCEHLPVVNSVVRVHEDSEWESPVAIGVIVTPTRAIITPKDDCDIKKKMKFIVEAGGWHITDNDILCKVCPFDKIPDIPADNLTAQIEYMNKNCIEASLFKTEHLAGDVMATCSEYGGADATAGFAIGTDEEDEVVVLNRYGVYVGIPSESNPEMNAMCVHEVYDSEGYTIGYYLNTGDGGVYQFGNPNCYIEEFFEDGEYFSMGEFFAEYLFESERMFDKYSECLINEAFLTSFSFNIPEWLTVMVEDQKAFWNMFRTIADDCMKTNGNPCAIQEVFDKHANLIKSTVRTVCAKFKKRVSS